MFKKVFPGKTEQALCTFVSKVLPHSVASTPDEARANWNFQTAYIDSLMLFLWRFRKLQHFFLAPGVAEFCVSSVRELTTDYCKRLPVCEPVEAPHSTAAWSTLCRLRLAAEGVRAPRRLGVIGLRPVFRRLQPQHVVGFEVPNQFLEFRRPALVLIPAIVPAAMILPERDK